MQKFTGDWGYRLLLLFWIGIGTFGLIFFGTTPMKHPGVGGMMFADVMMLMSGARGLLASWGLVTSFTIYEIDARSVTRHAWNGAQQMYWSDMIRVESNGNHDSALTLMDGRNEKLVIERTCMGSKQAAELNTLLEPRLALIRERQTRDIDPLNKVYYPKRGITGAGVFMSLIVGGMLWFVSVQPIKPGEGWAAAACLLFIGGMELLFVYLTIVSYTDTLILHASGLVEKDLFRTRAIDYADISSIQARTVHTRSGSWELTEIQGRGTKITLSAKMNDYDLLVRHVRACAG